MNLVDKTFKTISSRLKDDIEERINNVNNLQKSKVLEILKSHNVNVYKEDGEFRDVYDVLTDLSSIWDQLTDDEKSWFTDCKPYIENK